MGHGESSGKGSPPSFDGDSNSGGRSSPGPNCSNGDSYFSDFDRHNGDKKDSDAWKEYNDLVAELNNQWSGELTQRYKAEKDGLNQSESGIDQIINPLSSELEIKTSVPKNFEALLSQNIPVQLDGYRYLVNDRSELKPLLEYEYQSVQKDDLEKIREPLSSFKPNSPQSYNAYKAGLQALKQADQSYLQNGIEVGNFLKESAKILFDVATDLIPITSIPKDLYRTFVGKDPLSGRELVTFERVLAGGFVVLASVTLGVSNLLKGMKEIEVITGVSAKETVEAERIIESTLIEESAMASNPVGRRGNPIEIAQGTNSSTTIGGRFYTGHALDRMQGRGIPSSVLEDCIKNGSRNAGKIVGTYEYTTDGLKVITNENGKVITVITN
jgi:uncharacterized protein YukE